MNKKRLTRLHEILTAVQEYKRPFNMSYWFSFKGMTVNSETSEIQCSFVACAGGWAALDPLFNAQGLYYDFEENAVAYKDPQWEEEDEPLEDYEALQSFFGISRNQCRWLFDNKEYLHGMNTTESLESFYLEEGKESEDISIDLVLKRVTYLLGR